MRRSLIFLIVFAIVLPICICVLVALGGLLGAMGDEVGSRVLWRVSLAVGILWPIDLICLLLLQGISLLAGDDQTPRTGLE